jgi:hypothetical protein
MDMQQAMRKRLLDIPAISNVVGNRVDWMKRPQGSALPAIVLQVVNDTRRFHLKDYMGLRSTQVQVDVYGLAYGPTLALSRLVIEALKAPAVISGKVFSPTFVDSQRETTEVIGTAEVHRQSLDLNVWHKGD